MLVPTSPTFDLDLISSGTFDGLARQARDAHWPHEDYLHEVLSAEQASRHESVIRQRLHEARFDRALDGAAWLGGVHADAHRRATCAITSSAALP